MYEIFVSELHFVLYLFRKSTELIANDNGQVFYSLLQRYKVFNELGYSAFFLSYFSKFYSYFM